MANKLFGRFYFKKTINGNLIGEFSNNLDEQIRTESADNTLRNTNNDSFIGTYKTTWQENDTPCYATLTISSRIDSRDLIFILKWVGDNDKMIFEGGGMMCSKICIGDYRGV